MLVLGRELQGFVSNWGLKYDILYQLEERNSDIHVLELMVLSIVTMKVAQLSTNLVLHNHSEHIDIWYHFLEDKFK